MFNGKGQQWANGCLATTRRCSLLLHFREAKNGGCNPSAVPWTVYVGVTAPSEPRLFLSLSWAVDPALLGFQMGKNSPPTC